MKILKFLSDESDKSDKKILMKNKLKSFLKAIYI